MNTPFSKTYTTDTFKKDVHALADDTMKAARQHVVDPAIEAAQRAADYARDAMHETKDRLSHQVGQAEHYASEQYDRTAKWVSANPMSSVGIAFVGGLVISSFFGLFSRR